MRPARVLLVVAAVLALGCVAAAARGEEIQVLKKPADPYGAPRPAAGQEHFPLRGTVYLELGLGKGSTDAVLPESVAIELEPEGGPAVMLLRPGRQFAEGFWGRFIPGKQDDAGPVLSVYVDPAKPLRPGTKYTVRVSARSRAGATLPGAAGTWQFTTEGDSKPHALQFDLSGQGQPVRWQGGFFTGLCNVTFCNTQANRIPTNELIAEVRKQSPKAWSLQRDFWMTGMDDRPQFFGGTLPNIVRERETRRITAIDKQGDDKRGDGSVLRVEDFFGHGQYGIPSNRPLSADYHPGDEVLIADGVNHSRAKVVKADDQKREVLVTGLAMPSGGWKLDYAAPLPTKEDPNAPGLFPLGGCYLRKFSPSGTPVYYWGRLDKEWDLDVKRFGRRVVVNFADAPGDLSIDGQNWTTAKDYAEMHEVARAIAGHVIDRYGDTALTFAWSVFNEPDLGALFWRSNDWDELQKFYDYTVDGILRAFEDRGYDSKRVFIGGLELGGIFGVHLKLEEFLAHCSPRPQKVKGAIPRNAAFADKRLDGKRSKRVEDLCRKSEGRGSPCDFVSIHAYNRSKMMADKLVKAKEVALAIDPEYYGKLWINSHESTPGWAPPPDPAYADSFLGNGYYKTWCADVACRLLRQAAADPRYGFGESLLTVWPSPPLNFAGANDCVRTLHVDENGDGIGDRTVTIAMPILHFLGLLARMGPEFRVLPEQMVGGHVVSGFASQDGPKFRVLLYSHNAADTESRSDAQFDISLRLAGLKAGKITVEEYRFDKDHNSYFRRGRELRDQVEKAVKRIMAPGAYPAAVVKEIEDLSKLRRTGVSTQDVPPPGSLTIPIRLAGNGACFLVLEPAKAP